MFCDPRIREQDLGELEGAPWPVVFHYLQSGQAPKHGESRIEFTERVWPAVVAWANSVVSPKRVLFVGHGGTFFACGYRFGFICQSVANAVPHYISTVPGSVMPFRPWALCPNYSTSVLSSYLKG
jgi:hypothetical protein